jgi:uncharacterized membrane protein
MDNQNQQGAFDSADIEQNKVMAVLAYIGPLVLVPILAAKDSKFAKFHANQGLTLFICSFVYCIAVFIISFILYSISDWLGFFVHILRLLNLAFLVLAVLGIINAVNGQAKELPVIGKFQLLK